MKPIITVQRKITRTGDRYWYFSGGKPVSMSPRIALRGQRRGEITIKTVNDRP